MWVLGVQTQLNSLGGKYLYLPSHLPNRILLPGALETTASQRREGGAPEGLAAKLQTDA